MKITIEGMNKNGLPFEAIYTIDDQLLRKSRSPADFAIAATEHVIREAVAKTVHDDTQMPKSLRTSEIVIAGVTLIVHHLDNGQRVIEASSLQDLLEEMGGAELPEDEQRKLRNMMEGNDE